MVFSPEMVKAPVDMASSADQMILTDDGMLILKDK